MYVCSSRISNTYYKVFVNLILKDVYFVSIKFWFLLPSEDVTLVYEMLQGKWGFIIGLCGLSKLKFN